MRIITTDLDAVSGAGAAYDVGHAIGGALRSTADFFDYVVRNYNTNFAN